MSQKLRKMLKNYEKCGILAGFLKEKGTQATEQRPIGHRLAAHRGYLCPMWPVASGHYTRGHVMSISGGPKAPLRTWVWLGHIMGHNRPQQWAKQAKQAKIGHLMGQHRPSNRPQDPFFLYIRAQPGFFLLGLRNYIWLLLKTFILSQINRNPF